MWVVISPPLGRVFPHPSFSSISFFFYVHVFFPWHKLAACPKLQVCQLHLSYTSVWLTPSFNGASILLFLCLILSVFVPIPLTCHSLSCRPTKLKLLRCVLSMKYVECVLQANTSSSCVALPLWTYVQEILPSSNSVEWLYTPD